MPREHTVRGSGLVGWAAGREVLERIGDPERREVLAELLAQIGVQGAPALQYAARRLRWHSETREQTQQYGGPGAHLSPPVAGSRVGHAAALIDRRVIQLLDEAGMPVEHRPQRSAS